MVRLFPKYTKNLRFRPSGTESSGSACGKRRQAVVVRTEGSRYRCEQPRPSKAGAADGLSSEGFERCGPIAGTFLPGECFGESPPMDSVCVSTRCVVQQRSDWWAFNASDTCGGMSGGRLTSLRSAEVALVGNSPDAVCKVVPDPVVTAAQVALLVEKRIELLDRLVAKAMMVIGITHNVKINDFTAYAAGKLGIGLELDSGLEGDSAG